MIESQTLGSGSTSGATATQPSEGGAVYAGQARGGSEAYAAYYAGMDKSMQQKVALTTAYFPVRGTLADMGCGSGAGSHDLACLHDGLHVIGVDVAPESVAYAQANYRRPNLEYRLGDIAEPIFEPDSLDGVLNSSVFHHLTSFNGFSLDPVRRALLHQTAALRPGGVLIIRDFVVPRGDHDVLLDLPTRDGIAPGQTDPQLHGDIASLCTAALFERFALDFRSSQNPTGNVPYQRLGSVRPGWQRYRVSHRAAAEFVLRKDYRSDWAAECREEYTYFSQADFERELAAHDLRIALSLELRNPWIVENRFRGRFFLYDLDEKPLPYPPTNYLIVGEKVRRGQGIGFVLRSDDLDRPAEPSRDDRGHAGDGSRAPRFLRLSHHQHRETGRCFELVERPHPVVDLIPFFEQHGRLFVLGRQGYPRPLLHAAHHGRPGQPGGEASADFPWSSPNLDGARVAGYLTEPLTAMLSDAAELSTQDEIPAALQHSLAALWRTRVGLPERWIQRTLPGLRYFTSPGGLNERVSSVFIELAFSVEDLGKDGLPVLPDTAPNSTHFAGAGRVRPLLATQLLRAAQVGGLLDARLELNAYELLQRDRPPLLSTGNSIAPTADKLPLAARLGPWIGAEIALRVQARSAGVDRALLRAESEPQPDDDIQAVLRPQARAVFVPTEASAASAQQHRASFLRIERLHIAEHAADGQIVARDQLECALPGPTSCNTLSVFPVLRVGPTPDDVFVGIEGRDLPAPQAFSGSSRFATNPAWRLPRSIADLTAAEAWLSLQLRLQFGLRTLRSWPLGGKYYPAVGATPEQVYPLLAEVDAGSVADSSLSFIPLRELWRRRALIEDGHLRIGMWRLVHALSVL